MANFRIPTKKILSEQNISKIILLGISLRDEMENISKELIEEYDSTKTYSPNMACYYNDYLYRCLFATTGEFDINSWKKVGDSLELVNKAQVEAMLGLTPDELDTLANLILDSEVRLDKTWSSSKIYESVQEAIRENKKFTLEEFAKANKASYTVTDSVDTMTDQSTIYLLKNDTTYDIYIVQVDGTPTKIGDTTIDLSQFYTKTEIDNDFVKKTDADGKYALITTVDNHINDTVAHMTQSEKDSYALKSSITDTINSTSTSTDIASAKGVYDNAIKNNNIKTYTNVSQLGLTIPISVGDLFVGLPDNSLLRISCDNDEITGVPHKNGILIIDKCNTSKFSIEFKVSAGGSVNNNTLYIGQLKGVDGTGLTWSKLANESQITELKSKHFAGCFIMDSIDTFDLTQFGYPNTATQFAGIVMYISVYTSSAHGFYLCHFPLDETYYFSYYLGGKADVASFTKNGSKVTVTSKFSTSTISSVHGTLLGCN